jgi:glutamate N-acetyltransferase/amino-acid N-acetyltransferase
MHRQVKKELAIETRIDGQAVHIGGIARGRGMIHPNMGTMLCLITTDCARRRSVQKAIHDAAW